MTKLLESDRAIVKAMTFRDYDLYGGPEQQVERMAEYVAAYRERCVEAERERVLSAIEADVWKVASDHQYKNHADGIRVMLQSFHDAIAKLRGRS